VFKCVPQLLDRTFEVAAVDSVADRVFFASHLLELFGGNLKPLRTTLTKQRLKEGERELECVRALSACPERLEVIQWSEAVYIAQHWNGPVCYKTFRKEDN